MSVAIGTIAGTSGGERGKRNVVVEGPPVVKATQQKQKQRRMINTRESGATSRERKQVIGESAGSMLGRDLEALMQRARDYKKEYAVIRSSVRKKVKNVGGIENSMNLKPFMLGIDELINEFADDELIEKFADSQSYDYGYWVGRTVCLRVNTVSNDPNATFWKTRICSKWETIVQCVFGDKCHFAHGLSGKWRLLLCGIKAYTMHKMWAFTYMDMIAVNIIKQKMVMGGWNTKAHSALMGLIRWKYRMLLFVMRTDLVGEFVGHTRPKTSRVVCQI
ncbi:hypothetical protein L2E82_27447 [Cichorium intybus]|uniref:Uncharacterized protein n=1 Tax=Cichorium intybus TaxID=13427 RepID=A0ACB9CSY4_CICIN|nr:hypothetical protein L2E82_27447 [Cichorium intybus]